MLTADAVRLIWAVGAGVFGMAGVEAASPAVDGGGAQVSHFTTDTFREYERMAAWREVFGRAMLKLDIVPRSEEDFHARATILRSAGFTVLRATTSQADHGNARGLIANDNVSLVWIPSCRARPWQLGRASDLDPGDAVLMSHADVGGLAFAGETRFLALAVPKATLAPLVPDIGELFARRVPASTPALRMLLGYLAFAQRNHAAADPELQHAFAGHVSDLVALALGATRDAAELARQRGVPAARLRAMKDDIRQSAHRPDLSIHVVAARHGVSARYVQRVFEAGGSTFTQYLTEQRLSVAYKALRRSSLGDVPISTIAYDCGFSDVSHFNRLFRQRFGCTPGDVRKSAGSSD